MNNSVLIVGCGVMGLSTALHLSQRGYSVTAIDPYEVPSPKSAANDYNKIIRAEYTDMVYAEMGIEALQNWRTDPLFKGIYSECGRVMVTPQHHEKRKEFEAKGIENLQSLGHGSKIEIIDSNDELVSRFGFLQGNSLPKNVECKWNPESGLAHAANALRAVHDKCVSVGVRFIFGDEGEAIQIQEIQGKPYVVCKSGHTYTADKIIISSGASTGYIVDLQTQQSASGMFVTHIKLTDEEYDKYSGIPIVFDAELGYFFAPDPDTKLMKLALPGQGTFNFVHQGDTKKSLPRYKIDNPKDTIPETSVKDARKLMELYIPELAYHDLINSKICWLADTSDSHFIIDKIPYLAGEVYVATGDSGHAFKFLPNIGKYISDKVEGKLDLNIAQFWKWRENGTEYDPLVSDWRVPTGEELEIGEISFIKEVDGKYVLPNV